MLVRVKEHGVDRFGWVAAFLAGCALVAVGAVWVGNFVEDDTLISLRYAQRLLDGKGLTWNDGERVEGYSNLAWVLLAAGLGRLGTELILAVRILAFTSWVVTFASLLMFARRVDARWMAFGAATIVFGATASVSVWAMGALEQPLVVACLAVALWAHAALVAPIGEARSPTDAGDPPLAWAWVEAAALGLLVLARPDGPLFVAVLAVSAFILSARRAGIRKGLAAGFIVAALPFCVWLGQLGFRLAYYGEWVPNTAHVKMHLTWARASEGLQYVVRGLKVSWLTTLSGLAGLILALTHRRTRGLAWTILALLTTWTAYVIAIGGDHFPAFRHLLPVQFCCVALLILGLSTPGHDPTSGRRGSVVALGLALLLLVPYLRTQRAVPEVHVARVARWQWQGQAVAQTFATAFGEEEPLWAVTAAGCLPYFSGFPALDLLGLNDPHIAKQAPDPRLTVGHDHGDGAYVLKRAPDLITFGLPAGGPPMFKSGAEMAHDQRFGREYQKVRFEILEPIEMVSESYVRRKGRLGLSGSLVGRPEKGHGPGLVVPAYLLNGAVGRPMPDGSMGGVLQRGKWASIRLPKLPVGSYRLRIEPANSAFTVKLRMMASGKLVPSDDRPDEFAVVASSRLWLGIRPTGEAKSLRSLLIERITGSTIDTETLDGTTGRRIVTLVSPAP